MARGGPRPQWWPSLGVLDGHHRIRICAAHDLAYGVWFLDGITTREEAVNWVVAHQFGRRNLTPEQKSYLRGKRYTREKQRVRNPEGVNQYSAVDQQDDTQLTAERLGEEYGVSAMTIVRDGRCAERRDIP